MLTVNLDPAARLSWLLLDLCVIVVAARVLGRAAAKLRQPPVIGEIVAGIALGPSVLGLAPGRVDSALFPAGVLSDLNVLAALGLVVFMFLVGLEMDFAPLRSRAGAAAAISLASIVAPFGLGVLLALWLYPRHHTVAGHEVSQPAMVLFVGVAMSITAFPVLARILCDRGIQATPIGAFALAAAAIGDVIAWTLLALVVGLWRGGSGLEVVRVAALTAMFAALMCTVGRRGAARLANWHRRVGKSDHAVVVVVVLGILTSAWLTNQIGIHPIFGAFLFGVILPRTDGLVRDVGGRLHKLSMLLLPVFFVVTGFGVNIGGLSARCWAQLALIIAVAIGGKVAGAYLAARCARLPQRHSLVIAALINTRGLTELVIVSVGKQIGVIDGELFTMMVLMALITTAMTGPLVDLIYPPAASPATTG